MMRSTWLALACALTALAATRARADIFQDQLTPTPATTNNAVLHLSVTKLAPPGGHAGPVDATMDVLAGSTVNVAYDSSTGFLSIPGALLLGSDVSFSFGGLFQACVRDVALSVDYTDTAHYLMPAQVDGQGNFDLDVPVAFSGFLGSTCNGDQIVYLDGSFVHMQGTLTVDPGTGAMVLTNFATVGDFSPLEFDYPGYTFDLTGSVTLNFNGTIHPVFGDGFENGTTSNWSAVSP